MKIFIIISTLIFFASPFKLLVTEDFKVISHYPSTGAVLAFVEYNDTLSSNGWTLLTVKTNGSYSDSDQAHAAGVGEGYATAKRILQSWTNTMASYCVKPTMFCSKLKKFIYDNNHWLDYMIRKKRIQSSYWHHVNLIKTQIKGIFDGFNMVYPGKLKLEDLYLMNLSGDLEDLEQALGDGLMENRARKKEHMLGSGSCSALIKWVKGDILTSQITWNSYQSLIRIIKNYDFNFQRSIKGTNIIPGEFYTIN